MDQRCEAEVVGLHEFFVRWLLGTIAATDEQFLRCSDALAHDFFLQSPRGEQHDRAQILKLIREAHGQRATGFGIDVRNFQARHRAGDLYLTTYEEWQQTDAGPTARFATAVFRERANAPCGVQWVHLHETWLPIS